MTKNFELSLVITFMAFYDYIQSTNPVFYMNLLATICIANSLSKKLVLYPGMFPSSALFTVSSAILAMTEDFPVPAPPTNINGTSLPTPFTYCSIYMSKYTIHSNHFI